MNKIKKTALTTGLLLSIGLVGSLSSQNTQPVQAAVNTSKAASLDLTTLKNNSIKQTQANQLATGAVVVGSNYKTANGSLIVNPYSANLAEAVLLDNPTQSVLTGVKAWINWYYAHLNTTADVNGAVGTIYDYQVNAKGEVLQRHTTTYDSTDSYAASFLTLVAKYVVTTGDTSVVNKAKLGQVVQGMYTTLDMQDGLTEAKPGYAIKFLMDNTEVAQGTRAAMMLERNDLLTTSYDLNAIHVKTVKSLVNSFKAGDWYSSDLGGKVNPAFYPGGAAPLYLITNGVIDPESTMAADIMAYFNTHYGKSYLSLNADSYPWLILGKAYALTGDKGSLNTLLNNYNQKYGSQQDNLVYESAFAASLAEDLNLNLNYTFD